MIRICVLSSSSQNDPHLRNVIYSPSTKILKKYGMEKGKEREALWAKVSLWEEAVGGGQFRGGSAPDLSDISVYGMVKGLENLPIHGELMAKHADFARWYGRVEDVVKRG